MKPSFALDFRDGAVAVLHRTARGWMSVGQTAFGSPDMDEALAFLRSTALGLSPGGVATKLIIPNDQILYITVHAPGPEAAKRRKQILAALEGRTPYAVADLAFDWWGKGDEVNVAVIAKETLAEAEAFAHAHRFNPLSFVAVPDNGVFQGEPWFGPTSLVDQFLAPGQKVDRDQDPVRVIGHDLVPQPEAMPEAVAPAADTAPARAAIPQPDPVPEVDLTPQPQPDPVLAAEPVPPPMAEPVTIPEPIPEPEPEPEPEPAPVPQPAPEPAPPPESEPYIDPEPDIGPIEVPALDPEPFYQPDFDQAPPQPLPQSFSMAPALSGAQDWATAEPLTKAPVEADLAFISANEEAPMALDVDGDSADPVIVPKPAAEEPASGFSLLRAFASRRKAPAAPAPLKTEASPASKPEPSLAASLSARSLPSGPRVSSGVIASGLDALPDLPRAGASESSGMAVIGAAGAAPRAPGGPAKLSAERPAMARPLPGGAAKGGSGKAAKGLKGFGAYVTAPSITGPKKPRVTYGAQATGTAPGAAASANPSGLSPARPGTRPIGLGTRPIPQRGKPRYLGLILTGILLVLLALVAAWASFFLTASNEQAAENSAVAAIEQPASDIPAPEDEMAADMQDPADFTEAETADAAVVETASAETVADPAAEATAEPTATALEAAPLTGLQSDTGATTVTPAGDAQDEIFLAGIDSPPQPPDPSALGAPVARNDALPDPAVPPPPFGTVYQFDADGRIIPTPEGIATPEGVLLVAGSPSIVPTSRTAAVVAAAAAAQTPAAVPEAGADAALGNPSTVLTDPAASAADTPVFADPALQGFRPQRRPATLQVPSQTGAAEEPGLAVGSDSRFASLRPKIRPATIVALAAPAVDEVAIEAAVQSASLVTQGQVLPQGASTLAVAISPKPAARPAALSQTASASASASVASPAPEEPAAEASAAAAPEADAEPETDGPMPTLPTTASVAKQATVKDAVNLSKLTLIGIYGSDSRRYALVRQPNGRLLKVRVGDKLDGGKVVAIAPSELTYQKSGRAVTLEMPRT